MFRRIVAALVTLSTVFAVAWPVHARTTAGTAAASWDRCVGGKVVPAQPAGAVEHADCDRCCASSAAMPPATRDRAPMSSASPEAAPRSTRADSGHRIALSPPARAPPRS